MKTVEGVVPEYRYRRLVKFLILALAAAIVGAAIVFVLARI